MLAVLVQEPTSVTTPGPTDTSSAPGNRIRANHPLVQPRLNPRVLTPTPTDDYLYMPEGDDVPHVRVGTGTGD